MRKECPISTALKAGIVTLVLFLCQIGDKNHAYAQTDTLESLFAQLLEGNEQDAARVEEKIWTEWRKSGSDSVDFLLERGMAAMDLGRLGEAVEHFTAVIDHAPEFAEGWNMRATAFYLMGEFGLSVADIEHTLRLNPRHFGAMGGLGLILEESFRPEEALAVYKDVVKLHPKSAVANDGIARITLELQGTPL